MFDWISFEWLYTRAHTEEKYLYEKFILSKIKNITSITIDGEVLVVLDDDYYLNYYYYYYFDSREPDWILFVVLDHSYLDDDDDDDVNWMLIVFEQVVFDRLDKHYFPTNRK